MVSLHGQTEFLKLRPYLFDLMLRGPDRLIFLKFQLIMKIT